MVLRRMCNLKLQAPHTFVLRMKHIEKDHFLFLFFSYIPNILFYHRFKFFR